MSKGRQVKGKGIGVFGAYSEENQDSESSTLNTLNTPNTRNKKRASSRKFGHAYDPFSDEDPELAENIAYQDTDFGDDNEYASSDPNFEEFTPAPTAQTTTQTTLPLDPKSKQSPFGDLQSYIEDLRNSVHGRKVDGTTRHTSRELLIPMREQEQRNRDIIARKGAEFLNAAQDLPEQSSTTNAQILAGSLELDATLTYQVGLRMPWSVAFTIRHGERSWEVASLADFAEEISTELHVLGGRRMPSSRAQGAQPQVERALFSEQSQPLLDVAMRINEDRQASAPTQSANRRDSRLTRHVANVGAEDVTISSSQVIDLLRTLSARGVALSIWQYRQVSRHASVQVSESQPELGISFARVDEPDEHGFLITHKSQILAVLDNARDAYMLVQDSQDNLTFHHLSKEFSRAARTLQIFAGAETDNDLFIAQENLQSFAHTLLPALAKPALNIEIPKELLVSERAQTCEIEFYCDLADTGDLLCQTVAKYGESRVDVFADALNSTARASLSEEGTQVERDERYENLAREAVGQFMQTPFAVGRVGGEDLPLPSRLPQAPAYAVVPAGSQGHILELLTRGLPALKKVGTVYTTPAFDKLLSTRKLTVRGKVSMGKNRLIEFSAISDEVPADQISAILDSYRRHKRYHRLRDGSFVNLEESNLAQFDQLVNKYDISLTDLARGSAELPTYNVFELSGERDVVQEADFTAYLDSCEQIDATKYRLPKNVHAKLRPYQMEGFRWLNTVCDKGFGGILADDMGLGKTLQLISMLDYRYENDLEDDWDAVSADGAGTVHGESTGETSGVEKPSLVVCPASLVYNWARECAKFAPELRVGMVNGSKEERRQMLASVGTAEEPGVQLFITSYDLLRRDVELYQGLSWKVMALDEAQYIKNHGTKIAHAVKSVDAEHRFALTGTPIENSLSELWSIFDFLMPGMLRSYRDFRSRYEKPISDGNDEVLARLKALVDPFILRRTKSQVLTDLPPKIEDVLSVPIEGEQRKLYAAHEKQLKLFLEKNPDIRNHHIEILAELTKLRELCCDPRLLYANAKDASSKLDAIEQLVDSTIASGQKMLVFSQFTSFLDLIGARLEKAGVDYLRIDGSTASRERLRLVDEFNDGDVPVMLISLKAGGTGLNLTGAQVVVHADPWWNEAAQQQASDRAHRIGQQHTVTVYQVVAKDTIEERIVDMQHKKAALAKSILESDASGENGGAGAGAGASAARKESAVESLAAMTREDLLGLLS